MSKDDLIFVDQMLDHALKISGYLKDTNRQTFDSDEKLRLALIHLLQIVGEAARQISTEFQQQHPTVQWKAIMGMRHRIVHEYLRVDEDIVWETCTHRIPELIDQLQQLSR